jgi:lysophospholipase L1-like esterase
MKRIICFGDSNTYGYDPRSFLGGRYPKKVRWVDRLAEATGLKCINLGFNGRSIPESEQTIRDAVDSIAAALDGDGDNALWVMLGSNDLLLTPHVTAARVASKMKGFIEAVQHSGLCRKANLDILLIAPPGMELGDWCPDEATREESLRLGDAYRVLAQNLGIRFVDLCGEGLPLCFDGVHLTEEGHRLLAEKLAAWLSKQKR